MAHLPITDTLEAKLQRVAARYGLSLTRFLEKVADDYWVDAPKQQEIALPIQPTEPDAETREAIIRKEQSSYEEQHAELYEMYANLFIAMRDGLVIDHDEDKIALKERLKEKYGKQTIFVILVRSEARQTIWIRSPRLISNSPELNYTNTQQS